MTAGRTGRLGTSTGGSPVDEELCGAAGDAAAAGPDALRGFTEELLPLEPAGLATDLLAWCPDWTNWQEIAEALQRRVP